MPASGNYRVAIDASVNSKISDNSYEITSRSSRVTANTPLTNSENDFRVREIGSMQLEGGVQEISMRSIKPIRNYLLHLRGIYLTPIQ